MIRIRISHDAVADLDEGFGFYENQEAGLGDYFAATLRSEIEGLRITAGIHRRDYRDYRRLLGRVFPYAVYYLQWCKCTTTKGQGRRTLPQEPKFMSFTVNGILHVDGAPGGGQSRGCQRKCQRTDRSSTIPPPLHDCPLSVQFGHP